MSFTVAEKRAAGFVIVGFAAGVIAHDVAVITGAFERGPLAPVHGFLVGLLLLAAGLAVLGS